MFEINSPLDFDDGPNVSFALTMLLSINFSSSKPNRPKEMGMLLRLTRAF